MTPQLRSESPLRPHERVATDRYCDLFRAPSLAQLWSVWGTPTHRFNKASRDCDCGQLSDRGPPPSELQKPLLAQIPVVII